MAIPSPPHAVAAVAGFVRDRLAGVSDTLLGSRGMTPDRTVPLRQVALVIVGAAAPFAPTSYSRARLVRQLHASGLLDGDHLPYEAPAERGALEYPPPD